MIPNSNRKDSGTVLYGLGFDGDGTHKHITRGDNFYLTGGSRKTHSLMVDNVMEFNRLLAKYGKKMEDLSREEYYRIVKEIGCRDINWLYGPIF
ncbi:MAG: hypothetical protein C4541_03965 [Candidatus Auribacter fodinae]|jgi:phosphopantothenate synthetase|uniref:Uncharacterized protein n=1 Tax=Candidatus Auribacter fodinae TaxID=2093366 RepID=A0A3A4R658_9BACT|nr:MAG: hypothetical protein C4541_03965 [Candidatus Auribacter fodinae]